MTFQVGDIVTRGDHCEHEVLEVYPGGDVIVVKCIKAPNHRWIEVGQEETNSARRYELLRRVSP